MLGREHFEVDRDAGKSQVTSKHESESQAQRFALVDYGRAGIMPVSRKKTETREMLDVKRAAEPIRLAHAL